MIAIQNDILQMASGQKRHWLTQNALLFHLFVRYLSVLCLYIHTAGIYTVSRSFTLIYFPVNVIFGWLLFHMKLFCCFNCPIQFI